MIETKIKELLEKYFSNISNYGVKRIYFGNNYQTELIMFDFDNVNEDLSLILWNIKEICNKYSSYYIEPEIKMFEETARIKFRYFTRIN